MMRRRNALLFLIASVLFRPDLTPSQGPQTWDGSRTVPVHLIPLKDEFDQTIIPTETYPLPFSSRFTCGPCHDYPTIHGGLHFNASSAPTRGRPGEPWFWVDPATGTVLPLSYKGGTGVWHPKDIGLSAWDFTLLFGRHMNGGGINATSEEEIDPASRWEVSGKVEVNCLGCHNASPEQSHSEWAKQILRENFRWAATAASGLGEVQGMASRLPGTWDIYDGPNPDDTEWAIVPGVDYKPSLFDSKHRVFIDLGQKPKDARCLICHSASPRNVPRYMVEDDVHTAAGLSCVDCHRNDLSHKTIRGYEGESEDTGIPEAEDFTCRGCHLGTEGGSPAGRLGAPWPRHRGIPAVHFENLACTACHSGAIPDKDLTRVRTSRANRLGIHGVARWDTDLPHIVEPVFLRDKYGKITPHRLVWPSFWAEIQNGKMIPLKPEEIAAVGEGLLDIEQQAALVLTSLLDPLTSGMPVLVMGGRIFFPHIDGGLETRPLNGEDPGSDIFWALETEKGLIPLYPDFDPKADPPDQDAEIRVQSLLEGLHSIEKQRGDPVFLIQESLFRIVDGYLDISENPRKVQESPRLFWMKDSEFIPLLSEFQIRTLLATVGMEQSMTEEQVARVLEALAMPSPENDSEPIPEFVYISNGKLFQLDDEKNLSTSAHPAAGPVSWPLAHQVRPARQSLGIKGCKHCHSAGSDFFFSTVTGTGPLLTERSVERASLTFLDLDKPYQTLFGLSFTARPLFKTFMFGAIILIGAVLLMVFLLFLGRAAGILEKRS